MNNDNHFSDLIQKIDIIDVFERLGYKIIKRGNSRPVLLCPFHNDTTPSLTIYDNQYHCYACGAHGNIFSIIKHTKNCTFSEAVNWIEDQFPYIKTSINTKKSTFEEEKFKAGFEIAFDCYKKMDEFEYKNLDNFAQDRGYTKEFFIQSEIFYASANKLNSKYENNIKIQELLLEKDLLKEVAESEVTEKNLINNYKDVFNKDRVILTLRDYNNKIVGFAARAVKDAKGEEAKPKYLFTKELPKSKMLYKLNNVKEGCLRKDKNNKCFEIYITEGTFDALRLESLQFNAVSVLGSHITVDQVRVLADFIRSINSEYETIMIHIFLDTDSAGIEGAFKSIKNLLSDNITRSVYIDVIVNKNTLDSNINERKLKDPDEIGKNGILNNNWISNNTLAIFEFLMRYLCDKEKLMFEDGNLTFEEYFNSLDIRVKIALLRKLKNLFPYKHWKQIISFYFALNGIKVELNSDYFEFNIFKQFISSNDITNLKMDYKEGNKSDFQLINNAVKIARNGSINNDVPSDDFTWDRIEKCADIFNIFFYNLLEKRSNLDMPMLAINIPKNRSEYRLKVMYSHEQLIMQQYVLNELLRSDEITDVDFERFIPAIRYDNSLIYTTGWNYDDNFDEIKEKAVSFAYQIDMSVVNSQYIGNRSMFRPYYECWKSFIKYLNEGITKINKTKIYKVRLDIRKFYDCITRDSIRSALYAPLCEAFKTNSNHFRIMLGGDDIVESKTEKVLDWICKELFNYKYINPKSGKELYNQYSLMGIPQGPNLSAYLANIVLFSLDKAILKYVNKINSQKPGDDIGVRYARYVDDMIIVSENPEHLKNMKMIIVDELSKIGLDLSSKTDEAEEISKSEAYDWLVDERGGLAVSTAFDLADDSIDNDLSKYDDFLISNRKDILKLLRSMGNNFNIYDDIEEYIKVFFKTKEVKYNDVIRFCELILEYYAKKSKLSINEFEQVWKDNISLSDTECMLRRSDVMYLALIDAMIRILKFKINDFMSDEKKKEKLKLKKQLIYFIKTESIFEKIESVIKKTNIDKKQGKKNNSDTDLSQNEYLINFKLIMLLDEMLKINEMFKESNPSHEILDEEYYQKLPYIFDKKKIEHDTFLKRWMYAIDYTIRKSKTQTGIGSLFEFVNDKKDEEVGSDLSSLNRFHFAISRLMSFKAVADFDDIKGLLRINNDNMINESDIFESCLYLWFSNKEVSGVNEYKKYIKIAIFTLINIVPTHFLAEIISKNNILTKWLFDDSENNTEYLKVPSGVSYPGIIGIQKDDDKYYKVERIDFEEYTWKTKNLEWTTPTPYYYDNGNTEESNSSKIYCYASNAQLAGNWIKVQDYLNKRNSSKSIVEVYEQLIMHYKDDIDKTVFSKDNIFFIKDKKELEILSYKNNNDKVNNIVAISNGNESLKTVDVPVNGRLYWKIGTVLYDALNFNNFILRDTLNDEPDNISNLRQMEYYSLSRLKGSWMNKNYVSKSDNSFRRTVEKTLEELKKFDDTELKREFLLNCILKNHFINERMGYDDYSFKSGEVEYRLSVWAKNVIDKEYIRLENIVDDIDINNDTFQSQPARRTSLAYLRIGYRLSKVIKSAKVKENDDWVVDALELLKSSLFARSVLFNIRMQVMERIASLNEDEQNKFIKKDLPLDYFGISEDKVTILMDSEGQVSELKSIIENLFINKNDERTSKITLIGWLLLLCWLIEIGDTKNYIVKGRINNLVNENMEEEIFRLKEELLYDEFEETMEETQSSHNKEDQFPFEGILKFINNWNVDKCSNIFKILNKIDDLDKVHVEEICSDMFLYKKNSKDKNKMYMSLNGKRYDNLPAFIVTNSKVSEFDDNHDKKVTWTQTMINGNPVGISVLGNELEKLSMLELEDYCKVKNNIVSVSNIKITTENLINPMNELKQEENINKQNINKRLNEVKITENEVQVKDERDTKNDNNDSLNQNRANEQTKKDFTEMFRYGLDRLKSLQNDNWEGRKKKFKSLDRIALFQFEVDDSYQHPITEMCLQQEYDKLDDEIKVLELKKYPYNWNPDTSEIVDHSLYSCSEFRRRKLLEKVLEACDKFGVDILLLPEYSVRPETVIWMKNYIKSKPSENFNFSIWAGTLRIVPNHNLKKDNFISIGISEENCEDTNTYSSTSNGIDTKLSIESRYYDWAAVLPIILNKKFNLEGKKVPEIIIDKIKKYPALSLHEMINPSLALDSKQFGSIIKSRFENKLFYDAVDHVIEVICAEMFIMTCPSNIVNFSKTSRELFMRFNNRKITEKEYLDKTQKDIMDFGERISIYQDTKYTRTPIVLVPAYTTRATDYYVSGQAAYLSSGLTTVFCNAVGGESKGGSCFIGTDSWDNHNADLNIYLPDYSPYNGISPGIYKQFLEDRNRGALGEKEQALLICDINSDISFKGKPNPVSLGDTLTLVAHLPIIESSKTLNKNKFEIKQINLLQEQKNSENNLVEEQKRYIDLNKYCYHNVCRCMKTETRKIYKEICEICKQCPSYEGCDKYDICTKRNNCGTCGKVTICFKDGSIMDNIIKLSNYLISNNSNFINTIYDKNPFVIGETLMSIGTEINNQWLIKRGEYYLNQHISSPQSWPPPTSIDWMWVDVDYYEYRKCREYRKNQWEDYKIDIPKFTSVKKETNIL